MKLFSVDVRITGSEYVAGESGGVCMISFDGAAEGDYFRGKVIGTGVDTQRVADSGAILSARYMLEGTDADGCSCRIFVENNGSFVNGFVPTLVTDSRLLRRIDPASLRSAVTSCDGGVTVEIFGELKN